MRRALALALVLALPAAAQDPGLPTIYHLPDRTVIGIPTADGFMPVMVPEGYFIEAPAQKALEASIRTLRANVSLLKAENALSGRRFTIGLIVSTLVGALLAGVTTYLVMR